MEPELTLHKETIEISNGRSMYVYTFDLDGKPAPEMSEQDKVSTFTEQPENAQR